MKKIIAKRLPRPKKLVKKAKVLLGWTPRGKPVASIPVYSSEAINDRIQIWRSKGYIVSSVVEWDSR
jgi:hypothetical protein